MKIINPFNLNFQYLLGHFTQIVWKNTTEMGIAMAKRDGTCVIVACYHPRGNIVGQFTENVLKPVKTAC